MCAAKNIELTNRFEPVAAATATAHLLANLLARAAAADLGLDDLGCQPLELLADPVQRRRGDSVPARPRAPRVDVAQTTAAMSGTHAHGDAGFAARARSAPTGTAADDAYLGVLDQSLVRGVLDDDNIAVLCVRRSLLGTSPPLGSRNSTEFTWMPFLTLSVRPQLTSLRLASASFTKIGRLAASARLGGCVSNPAAASSVTS